MFPFRRDSKDSQTTQPAAAKQAEAHPLDALTGGVFSAATSGERAQRLRDWLAANPSPEQMQEVYKELSAKDKGAAKPLREKLDELRRARTQEAAMAEWQAKAEALLQTQRLNIADALAWQRDAARAGAPLSREPLAALRAQLAERVRKVEDLQQQVMVQREAALLLAQRIELFSTKPWADAQAQQAGLDTDVAQWRTHAADLMTSPHWHSVEARHTHQLEAAQTQLNAVWEAFVAALGQAVAASQDAQAPLPPVPVWADELRAARGEVPAAAAPEKPARPKVDPAQRMAAQNAVQAGVMLLEQAVAAGHTKNMHSATQALRQSLKTHGRLIDDALEARVHAALIGAGELEGWQRWSADKVREQLVAKAEALLVKRKKKPAPVQPGADQPEAPAAAAQVAPGMAAIAQEGAQQGVPEAASEAAQKTALQEAASEDAAPASAPSDATAPQSAAHADESMAGDGTTEVAADAAVKVADVAQGTAQPAAAESAAAAAQASPRPVLAADEEWAPAVQGRKLQDTIRQLRAEWKTADQGGAANHALWKRFDRALNIAHGFVDEWLGKIRAESAQHRAQRLALIDEVKAWAPTVAADGGGDWKAVNRQIHQFSDRWRNAGHLSEKQYAELQAQWKEAIDQAAAPLHAAQRQSVARRQALIAEAQALAAAPLRVDAVRALQQRWQAEAQAVPIERRQEQKLWDAFRKPLDEAFNRKGAERERQQAAMSAHDQAVLQAAKALEEANASGDAQQIRAAMAALQAASRAPAAAAPDAAASTAPASVAADATANAAADAATDADGQAAADPAAADAQPAAKPAKPLIAMRGDDRPGAQKAAAEPSRGGRPERRMGAKGERGERRFGERPAREDRGPRLGDAAFRAQRDAVEHAQAQLKKLAAQAHGEALVQLMAAWAARQPDLPAAQELGRAVTPAVRASWAQAIAAAPAEAAAADKAAQALLRLEIAADTPTPAEHLSARKALQLQLLVNRKDPAPAETWAQDTAAVLASAHDQAQARRLQNALKNLLQQRADTRR